MNTYQGTIIEQSLSSTDILKTFKVVKTWTDDDWILHDVVVDDEDISIVQQALREGSWYIHVWHDDEMVIIFKEKIFRVNRFDIGTWNDAIEYGLSIGVPREQLDFLTE
jgi:hypothetical protein